MRPLKTDLSVYKKFNFENLPVGVKLLPSRPESIERLGKSIALCEMIKEAQQREWPFYMDRENESCFGKKFLGMGDREIISGSGNLGVEFEVFQEARANWRLYQYQSLIPKGAINYVAFSRYDKLTFDPDLLIIMATISQAEIIMRAMSYSTGEIWSSRLTPVGACSWLFAYPYQSGKVNWTVTGIGFGMKAKQVFPEGWILISIPYDWIHIITQNLKEMKWVLPSYEEGREKFLKREESVRAKVLE